VFLGIYLGKFNWIEKFKGNDEPWPWEKDPVSWKKHLKKMLLLNFLNMWVIAPIMTYTSGLILPLYRKEELPSFWLFWVQFWWMIMMEDFLFYWGHRFLHIKWLYPYIHKMHHESIQTVSLSAVSTHPLEYTLGNIIPTVLGIIL